MAGTRELATSGNRSAISWKRKLAVRITGHRFRHVAGFLYLQDNPNGYEVVRLLLGHKNIWTTIRYYTGCEVEEAHLRFDEFMSRRRLEIGVAEPSALKRRRRG